MKITLTRKIFFGFIICSLILAFVAVFSFKNSEQLIATNRWVNHTHDVLNELEQITVDAVDAETGARGFVITGNEAFLEPYTNAKAIILSHLDNVKILTSDNSIQQRNIDELSRQIRARLSYLETIIKLREAKGFEAAKEIIEIGKGKQLQDNIRKIIDNCISIENVLLDKRREDSNKEANHFNAIFIVLLLIITIILVSVYVIIIFGLNKLKKAEQETTNKNWTLTGSSELVKHMQGNKLIHELGQSILNYLTPYVNAQVGALYLTNQENNHLIISNGYAIDEKKVKKKSFAFGEGLIGQAAAEKRIILFNTIPQTYLPISTSFADIAPKTIIEIPLILEGNTIGVIELGSVTDFTELQQQYLNVVRDSIAIAIASATAREQTKELLKRTQHQAEELLAQQEELKQANEELHQKTNMLEESETELISQQEELQQTNLKLEEKANLLEEQKEQLEQAKVEIEIKAREVEISSKYKSEFLANMSHELRTPLNGILILSQLLTENKNKMLGEKEIEFAININKSGKDLLRLINDILDLAKIEAGRMDLEIADIQIADITNNMSALFTEYAKSKFLTFKIDFNQEELPRNITTDQQLVEQILKNLLSNALKFSKDSGTVTLTVSQQINRKPFKMDSLISAKEYIAFSVIDNGIGIPENKQSIIFEAFQQADGSTKRKYGGTGLGLSISQQLANALGGEIHLISKEGEGSNFTLYLPLSFSATTEATLPNGIEKEYLHPKQENIVSTLQAKIPATGSDDDRNNISSGDHVILIIEDNRVVSTILLDFVRSRNYKGIVANQGSLGINYTRKYIPYAIILDMQLPVMGGIEVLKHLKKDRDLRHIPVQIISAYDEFSKEAMTLGAFDYLHKPVTTAELEAAFDRIEHFINKKLKKLLVVEDNKLQNLAIQKLIGNGDVKCSSAYTGTEAYTMLTEAEFDCLIVDLGLPDMSGFELLEKIKTNEKLNKIPIIVYTGREVNKEENLLLSKLSNTVVLKTVNSHERLLDETVLFLHKVESKLPQEKQRIIRTLHENADLLKGKKILLVDDDMRNIYALSNALEEEGVKCYVAETGKAALEMLKQHPTLDLVLMDVMMPEMDGYEATAAIRKIPAFSNLPIIALTAKVMKEDKEKCLEAGMSDFIAKPLNIENLFLLLRLWLYK